MLRNLLLKAILFCCLLLVTGCDSEPRIAPLGQASVILAFGDSLTRGNGAAAGQAYPDVLGNLLGKPVINAGIPGEVSAAGLARLPDMLDKYNPTLVILCHGGNDFLRRLDQNETVNNLKGMVALIHAHGADVILVGVPKLGFGLEVPKFYTTIAAENKIPFEGRILLDLLGDNALKSDTIHPNAAGYRLLGEALYKVINQAQRK